MIFMFRLVCLIECVLFFTPLFARNEFLLPVELIGSFTGQVKDLITQQPIAGVSVYFADIKVGASTDENGKFSIQQIPEGKHLVEISHIGYSTIAEQIDIIGKTSKEYFLKESVVENNAVVITGLGSAAPLKKSPFQVSLLRKEELMQSASINIIDALTKKPGVSSLSSGPAIAKPVIRGLGYNRVLTINDGVRQEGQQWGDEHGIEIDESSVSKVEILKGPATLIYGSDALAGVINIITNVPVEKNRVKANVLSNYQSNNQAKTIHANIAGNVDGFNWNLYGTSVAAIDYQNKYDGRVFNSKHNEKNFGGYAGYNGQWGYTHLLISQFNLKAGLVDGSRDLQGYFVKQIAGGIEERTTENDFNSSTPQIPYQHIRHFKIATDNSIKFGKNRLTVNVGFQQNRREEFGNPDAINERALYFDLKTITYSTQFHFQEWYGWKTVIGINGMRQLNTNKGMEQIIPDYSLFDIGGFLFAQKTIKKLTWSGGARMDNRVMNIKNLLDGNAIKANGFSKSFTNFSASAGLAAQLNKQFNLKLNAARAFRTPSIPELASNGAHEGTIRYEYGDKNLQNEISLQFDAGLEFSTEHISINLAGFYNSFNHFIFYRKLQTANGSDSTLLINGNELTAFKFDQQNAALSGVEAIIDLHPHPLDWLHIQNSFSLTAGRLKKSIEGSGNLPFMPAARILSELRCNFKKLSKHVANFYAKMEVDNTFKQNSIFSAYNTETVTEGYTLLNAGIGADIISAKGKTILNIYLTGNNLADIAYQNHLSRLKYADENRATGRLGVFNMGRNFSIKLNVPLSMKLKSK